ncbi:MAG: hypothetical protein OXB92_12165 [Acidimicrobiaceae bacterium]|nr:hypothetical protein [Acidimicrobiia bacterium]MCY4494600.1 hypothetical protein [Acidimicrobiaceae bacterium]
MGLKRFITNLLSPPNLRRRQAPTAPKSSEAYAEEIETEKERRRGMRGF